MRMSVRLTYTYEWKRHTECTCRAYLIAYGQFEFQCRKEKEKKLREPQCRSDRLHTVESVEHKHLQSDGINCTDEMDTRSRARHRKCIELKRCEHGIRVTIRI